MENRELVIGNWEWGIGNGELVIDINQKRGKQTGKRKIIPDALCPMPDAQFPMPYSPCPMPHAPCPIPIK
ncbi:MAG: hypothetical protein QQW96_13650 [Tychonema bourrellyi B0820]|nr:hypothetical protein [Tychonema bourrellyi B0820]